MAVIAYQYRGDLVDQIHRGHIAVTDHTGRILWKLGDPVVINIYKVIKVYERGA